MRFQSVRAFAIGAAFALVVGGSGAYAATGGDFVLGKKNTAGTTSTLKSMKGSALSLKSKGSVAPLKVSNSQKVAKLNADLLDGIDGGSLATKAELGSFALKTAQTGSFDAYGVSLDVTGNGVADSLLATALCPPGTQMTGGGFEDYTGTGIPVMSTPASGGREGWIYAVIIEEFSGDIGSDIVANITCYNPSGAIPGSYRTPVQRAADVPEKVERALSAKLADR